MEPTEHQVTSGGRERVQKAADVLAPSFEDDPVLRYLLNNLGETRRHQYLFKLFRAFFTSATLNGGIIAELKDWACCAILMPPGKRVDNPMTFLQSGIIGVMWSAGIGATLRIAHEYPALADAAKAKALNPKENYYYVFFIATKETERKQGLTSKLIKHYQTQAAKEGLPIWLEATTPKSASVYSKLGFETIDEFSLGKGHFDIDGKKKKDGAGVPVWAMLWRPPKEKLPETSNIDQLA